MDHAIEDLNERLRAFNDPDSDGWVDERAIKCIENAKKKLEKYYVNQEAVNNEKQTNYER